MQGEGARVLDVMVGAEGVQQGNIQSSGAWLGLSRLRSVVVISLEESRRRELASTW